MKRISESLIISCKWQLEWRWSIYYSDSWKINFMIRSNRRSIASTIILWEFFFLYFLNLLEKYDS